uniref:Secreted protein n=1 Tax=Peronospora matthiolae TaxID=2874970 RepID=A0AAV1U3Y7_9STRA
MTTGFRANEELVVHSTALPFVLVLAAASFFRHPLQVVVHPTVTTRDVLTKFRDPPLTRGKLFSYPVLVRFGVDLCASLLDPRSLTHSFISLTHTLVHVLAAITSTWPLDGVALDMFRCFSAERNLEHNLLNCRRRHCRRRGFAVLVVQNKSDTRLGCER